MIWLPLLTMCLFEGRKKAHKETCLNKIYLVTYSIQLPFSWGVRLQSLSRDWRSCQGSLPPLVAGALWLLPVWVLWAVVLGSKGWPRNSVILFYDFTSLVVVDSGTTAKSLVLVFLFLNSNKLMHRAAYHFYSLPLFPSSFSEAITVSCKGSKLPRTLGWWTMKTDFHTLSQWQTSLCLVACSPEFLFLFILKKNDSQE